MKLSKVIEEKFEKENKFEGYDDEQLKAMAGGSVFTSLIGSVVCHTLTMYLIMNSLIPYSLGVNISMSLMQCFILFTSIDVLLCQILKWDTHRPQEPKEAICFAMAGLSSSFGCLVLVSILYFLTKVF